MLGLASYSVPLCGHKSVINWPVKPVLQLWCVIILVAQSSQAVAVHQAVRAGRLAGSPALPVPCTAADKAGQPPLEKMLSADTVHFCARRGRQIRPDILSQILLCG